LVGLIVWSSLVPPIPFLGLALTLDSPETVWNAMTNLNGLSIFAVLYLAFGATLLGYGVWSGLLTRYPAARVVPLSLLVPVTGLITARIVLGEQFTPVQWLGGFAVVAGLMIGSIGVPKVRALRRCEE
jgi:O-acetylserine/cysteine efflux transporter